MDIKEMIAVVQAYINHRKDLEVDININQFRDPINILKLKEAYDISLEWFRNNNGSIKFK